MSEEQKRKPGRPPVRQEEYEVLNVEIPPHMMAWLRRYAARNRWSIASAVRDALTRFAIEEQKQGRGDGDD